jgi:outer membrane protein OmpA-like peptidoglycan-associated protein
VTVSFDFAAEVDSPAMPAAAPAVAEAADAVKSGKVVQITATGHTDTAGSASYNQGLSERRAASVKQALVADGVREPRNRRAEIVLR